MSWCYDIGNIDTMGGLSMQLVKVSEVLVEETGCTGASRMEDFDGMAWIVAVAGSRTLSTGNGRGKAFIGNSWEAMGLKIELEASVGSG
jgi:hypothetical protein